MINFGQALPECMVYFAVREVLIGAKLMQEIIKCLKGAGLVLLRSMMLLYSVTIFRVNSQILEIISISEHLIPDLFD